MQQARNILLIGFGNMGRALAQGWLEHGREPQSVHVLDTHDAALAAARALGLSLDTDRLRLDEGDVIVFAVKPQQLSDVLREHSDSARSGATVLSIVAGKRIATFSEALGAGTPIVRAMPNTPAAIGEGMTVLCANSVTTVDQRAACEALMRVVGEVEWVTDEFLLDAVTALSGSGPAYVFLLIESLADAGIAAGLSRELALRLAVQTVAGAGAYARESGEAAADLRKRVTSPGGTTAAALEVLMGKGGLPALMIEAVQAATERSRELSRD
jgi:pyrroline-5-carboxylate reductase